MTTILSYYRTKLESPAAGGGGGCSPLISNFELGQVRIALHAFILMGTPRGPGKASDFIMEQMDVHVDEFLR